MKAHTKRKPPFSRTPTRQTRVSPLPVLAFAVSVCKQNAFFLAKKSTETLAKYEKMWYHMGIPYGLTHRKEGVGICQSDTESPLRLPWAC